jgi:hypothetical protein
LGLLGMLQRELHLGLLVMLQMELTWVHLGLLGMLLDCEKGRESNCQVILLRQQQCLHHYCGKRKLPFPRSNFLSRAQGQQLQLNHHMEKKREVDQEELAAMCLCAPSIALYPSPLHFSYPELIGEKQRPHSLQLQAFLSCSFLCLLPWFSQYMCFVCWKILTWSSAWSGLLPVDKWKVSGFQIQEDMGSSLAWGLMKPAMGGSRDGCNGTRHSEIEPFSMESEAC